MNNMDVAKADQEDAPYVALFSCACFNCMFLIVSGVSEGCFICVFWMYVATVFIWMLHMFVACMSIQMVPMVAVLFNCVSRCFKSISSVSTTFRVMLQSLFFHVSKVDWAFSPSPTFC